MFRCSNSLHFMYFFLPLIKSLRKSENKIVVKKCYHLHIVKTSIFGRYTFASIVKRL